MGALYGHIPFVQVPWQQPKPGAVPQPCPEAAQQTGAAFASAMAAASWHVPLNVPAMFEHFGEEFRSAPLGDPRRSARLERIGEALSRDPASSFPEAMGSEGQLEALYRFLNNDAVNIGRMLQRSSSAGSKAIARLKASTASAID